MNNSGRGVRPGSRAGLWRAGLRVLVVLLGSWTFYSFIQHLRGETLRPRVESAAVMFAIAGLALVLSSPREDRGGQPILRARAGPAEALWLFFVAVSFALYWPTTGIGLLSDDWVLWDRAANWSIGPVTTELVRPLPLLIWAVLINVGASPAVLHMLNIVLHGTNAWLTTRLCEGWIGAGRWSILAGALMIALPVATEPVSWAAGVFDLSVTVLVLLFVLRGRYYDSAVTLASRAIFIAIGILAMAAKETGAIAGLLMLIDAWIRRKINRQLLIDTGIVLGLAIVFSAIRLTGAFGLTTPALSRYRLQRALFETFGGLAVPFHTDVLRVPGLAELSVFIVVALFTTCFVATGRRSDRLIPGAATWILISILPLLPFVFVAPDLQGARYLYLAGPAWSALVAGVALSSREITRRILTGVTIGLVVLWAVAVRVHLKPWTEAALARDEVTRAAQSDARLRQCRIVAVTKLPDTVRGAYVFRNGTQAALAREAGLHSSEDAAPGCVFEWNGREFRAISRAPE
jgi:hypothetical protein